MDAQIAVVVLLAAAGAVLIFTHLRARSAGPAGESDLVSPRPSPAPLPQNDWPDGPWRIALLSGDGDDWVGLSDEQRTMLCRKAAHDLGKSDRHARTYRAFLDGVFRRPDPIVCRKPIVEILAACQVGIDNGAIRLE